MCVGGVCGGVCDPKREDGAKHSTIFPLIPVLNIPCTNNCTSSNINWTDSLL